MTENKFHIIIATEVYPPDIAGPATFIKRITPELNEAGFKVTTLTYADQASESEELVKVSRQTSLINKYLAYFFKLKKLADKADLIFAQGPLASGLPAVLVKKLTGKKVIMKIVGDVVWERARNNNLTGQTIDEFQKAKHNFKVELQKKIRNWLIRQVDLAVVPSNYFKGLALGWGLKEDKIRVIYNSFESHRLDISKAEAKQKLNLNGEVMLSVGRLTSWKGFDILIDLMPVLLMKKPDLKLVICGSGPQEEKLKAKIKDLKLEDKVIMAGQVNQSEIKYYYRAADLFILNSAYEGLSHTLLEALSYGLPCLASRIGGNPEVIEDKRNGLLFEYNNQQEILNCLTYFWQDNNLRFEFEKNSKQILQKFTFSEMTNHYIEVLKV